MAPSPVRSRKLNTVAAGCVLLLLAAVTFAQSEEEETRQQLQALEESIQRISFEISQASSERDKLQNKLRDAEVEVGDLKQAIDTTQRELERLQEELEAQRSEQTRLNEARDMQQARIAAELRTAWRMGNQGQLKLLLNQGDPDTVARTMAYYRRIFDARQERLAAYRELLADIDAIAEEIDVNLQTVDKQRAELSKQYESLTQAQAERELAILALNARIDDGGKTLEKLEKDRKELNDLLRAIEDAVVNLTVPDNYQPFHKASGAMPWPIEGKASNRFGRPRNAGKMRWQGITIPAEEGRKVHAIHHGRVVYSDWLRGSGLLLIIDHGDGYMSLYAHNSSLLKDVGEWVSAGTPIAEVGSTGGRDYPALYFEVRHKGKPVDPAKWCTD